MLEYFNDNSLRTGTFLHCVKEPFRQLWESDRNLPHPELKYKEDHDVRVIPHGRGDNQCYRCGQGFIGVLYVDTSAKERVKLICVDCAVSRKSGLSVVPWFTPFNAKRSGLLSP